MVSNNIVFVVCLWLSEMDIHKTIYTYDVVVYNCKYIIIVSTHNLFLVCCSLYIVIENVIIIVTSIN